MKMDVQIPGKQKGFSLLTGFILVIILFGSLAFFLAGQGINTGFATKYTNSAKASGLLTSAGYINTGFDAITLGGESPDNVTFDSGVKGVFNPTVGGATLQTVDPELLARATASLDGIWVYRKAEVTLKGIGDSGAPASEYTMMVSGLKKAICQQINYTLHGIPLATNPTSTGLTDAQLVGAPLVSGGAATATGVVADLSAVVAMPDGWMSGCFATTTAVGADVNYVYIHTLLPR